MAEETKEIKEIKETLEIPQSDVSAADELAAATAQLNAERKAKDEALANVARLTETMEKKDFVIADLETKRGELEGMQGERDSAIAKYREIAQLFNPTIPEGIIAGDTVEAIDASIDKGKAVVEAVRKALTAQAEKDNAGTKVPAGSPVRSGISTESMSPREKIAAGILPKGGN